MDYIISGIGILIGVIGITLFWLSQREIRSLIKQLNEINYKETNQKIMVRSSSALYKTLATKLNETIEEKKQSQRDYIKMEKELKETIANLSHDIRTPLTSISGYLQLLQQEDLDEEKKKKYLQIISGRTRNLQGLVESFYELSQLNSSEYKLECEEIHIERIMCELIASFYQDFVDKGLSLQIDIQENLPSAYANEGAVTRILLNLIQNTLRYAHKNIQIKLAQEGIYIKLSIINESGELKEDDVPYLFDRFFMGNRVRNGEGTGVGLAVVKKLVILLGGKVEAEIINERLVIEVYFKIFREMSGL